MKILSTLLVLLLSVASFAQEALPKPEVQQLANATKDLTLCERESWEFEVEKEGLVEIQFSSESGVFNVGVATRQDYKVFRRELETYEEYRRLEMISPFVAAPVGSLVAVVNPFRTETEKKRLTELREQFKNGPPCLRAVERFTQSNVLQSQRNGKLSPGEYVVWVRRVAKKGSALKDLGHTVAAAGDVVRLRPSALNDLAKAEEAADPDVSCKVIVTQR